MTAEEKKKLIMEIRTVANAFESMIPSVQLGDLGTARKQLALSMVGAAVLSGIVFALSSDTPGPKEKILLESLLLTGPIK